MPQTLASITTPLTFSAFKEFAATSGPALTLYLPTHIPGGPNRRLSARLQRLDTELQSRCAERGLEGPDCQEFLSPLSSEAESIQNSAEGPGLVLFRAPGLFRHYWIPREVEDAMYLADNFHIRPVLDLLHGEKRFYVLAIAQKDPRMLLCTEHSSEVVELGFPSSLLEFTDSDQPDHNLRNNSTSGPGSPAVSFGTGADKDQKDEYLWNYYTAMNRAVVERLKDTRAPLVIAGVEFELAIYRKVNTYPGLCQDEVRGAANGLKGGELHTRALEAVAACERDRVRELLAQHDKQGGGVADAPVRAILKAAYEGRVASLLVGDTAAAFGNFDEAAHRVHQHSRPAIGDEDLINAAAVQTIVHAGEVFVLPAAEIPGQRPMAAVMRY